MIAAEVITQPETFDEHLDRAWAQVFPRIPLSPPCEAGRIARLRGCGGVTFHQVDNRLSMYQDRDAYNRVSAHFKYPWRQEQFLEALMEIRAVLLGWAQEILYGCGLD